MPTSVAQVYKFLELAHIVWPNLDGKRHNLTAELQRSELVFSLWDGIRWQYFILGDSDLDQPEMTIERMARLLGGDDGIEPKRETT